jgi:hypothetical protein
MCSLVFHLGWCGHHDLDDFFRVILGLLGFPCSLVPPFPLFESAKGATAQLIEGLAFKFMCMPSMTPGNDTTVIRAADHLWSGWYRWQRATYVGKVAVTTVTVTTGDDRG